MKTSSRQLLLISIGLLCLSEPAMAERRGAGFRSGMAARGGARTSVTARPTAGNFNYNRSNTNVNRPIQVDDVDVGRRAYYGRDDGCCYRPVARAAAVGAVTAAAIGSVIYALPSSCTAVVVDGVTYQQCGSTWYQPQFSCTTTTHVVVSPPQ